MRFSIDPDQTQRWVVRRMSTLLGVSTVRIVSEKGSTLKGKNLLLLEANSFFLEYIPLQKELDVEESN